MLFCIVQLTLRNLFQMDEFLEYTPHPDDPSKWESSCQGNNRISLLADKLHFWPEISHHVNRTLLRQTARMNVFGIPLLGDILESMLISNYSSVVSKVRPKSNSLPSVLALIHCLHPLREDKQLNARHRCWTTVRLLALHYHVLHNVPSLHNHSHPTKFILVCSMNVWNSSSSCPISHMLFIYSPINLCAYVPIWVKEARSPFI